MNILETITERTKERIREEKKQIPINEIRKKAEEKAIPMVVCPFFCLTTKSILRLSYNIKLVKSSQIKTMHSYLAKSRQCIRSFCVIYSVSF